MNLTYILHATEAKQDKKGTFPIKALLDCNGERLQVTVPKIRAKREHWCNITHRLMTDAPNAQLHNLWLDRIEERYQTMYRDSEMRKKRLTAKEVKAYIFAQEAPRLDVFSMIDEFLQQQAALTEAKELAQATYWLYQYRAELWKAYFKQEGITEVLQVGEDIQVSFYQFARKTKPKRKKTLLHHNTVVSLLVGLRVFFEYCRERKWLKENPIRKVKYSNKQKEKIYLTEEELEAIRTLDLTQDKILNRARDLFLLVCGLGLSYSDLSQISPKNIRIEEGREFLTIKRKKTGVEGGIPLFEEVREILGRYGYQKPKLCYPVYMGKLKELQQAANLDKPLTSHVARKTFGYLMLNKYLVPLEMVSKMMCHTSIQTTAQYYTEIDLKTVCRHTAHIK